MLPFIFLLIGLLLIFLEFYLPGAIMATLGGIFFVASILLFAGQNHSAVEIFLFTIGSFVALFFLIRMTLQRIPKTKAEYSIYSHKDQEGYQASQYDKSALGKEGVVLSDLKPGGYILIAGTKHQAISQSGYISQGTHVLVIGGQEESLIVKNVDI
jgi:membrane-bound ClpP family serine protease